MKADLAETRKNLKNLTTLGHRRLSGKDQAAPARAVRCVVLADVDLQELLMHRAGLQQDGHHAAAVL